jgi:hypothetical protein
MHYSQAAANLANALATLIASGYKAEFNKTNDCAEGETGMKLPKRSTVDEMVDRFLSWKLPGDFAPDAGIDFIPHHNTAFWPVGTNLFTADQAREMITHMLTGNK